MEVPRIVLVLSTDEGLLLFYFPVVTCDFRNKISIDFNNFFRPKILKRFSFIYVRDSLPSFSSFYFILVFSDGINGIKSGSIS